MHQETRAEVYALKKKVDIRTANLSTESETCRSVQSFSVATTNVKHLHPLTFSQCERQYGLHISHADVIEKFPHHIKRI